MGNFASTKYIPPIDLDMVFCSVFITIRQVSFAMGLVLADNLTYFLVGEKG